MIQVLGLTLVIQLSHAGLGEKTWSQYLPETFREKHSGASVRINEKQHKNTSYFTECQVFQAPKAFGIINCEHDLSRGSLVSLGKKHP